MATILENNKGRPTEGIATDAAHSTKNGLTCFRAVDLSTGEELFTEEIGNQTVNIGEFLGVVTAIKYIIDNAYSPKIIYTDSMTAIAWCKAKKTGSKKKYAGLKKAEAFLKAMAVHIETIQILHWENDKWGETPADYGNK